MKEAMSWIEDIIKVRNGEYYDDGSNFGSLRKDQKPQEEAYGDEDLI